MTANPLTSGDSDDLDASPSGVVAQGENRSYDGLVCSVTPQSPDVSEDPNADLINYVFKVDGGTGTVTGTTPWDSAYVKIWCIKRNVDYYCRACDLYSENEDNCFMCGALLEMIEADPDERMLGWETVRSAELVRKHKEAHRK
jgi:hypothetical protein